MAHLALNTAVIDRCRSLAESISSPVEEMIHSHTTVAIERTVLQTFGSRGRGHAKRRPNDSRSQCHHRRPSPSRGLADGVLTLFRERDDSKEDAGAGAGGVPSLFRKIDLLKLPKADPQLKFVKRHRALQSRSSKSHRSPRIPRFPSCKGQRSVRCRRKEWPASLCHRRHRKYLR